MKYSKKFNSPITLAIFFNGHLWLVAVMRDSTDAISKVCTGGQR